MRTDARALSQWERGGAPDVRVLVARDMERGRAIGFALITMKADLLNGSPSAHLGTLAVAEGWEGRGVGMALMQKTEELAVAEGAQSLTLHVFDADRRARALYEREWLRYAGARFYWVGEATKLLLVRPYEESEGNVWTGVGTASSE